MNYQLKLEQLLEQIDINSPKLKLLLHACCGPCSSYCLEYLSKYFDITILYYNPNIYPDEEYHRRFNELKNFISQIPHGNQIDILEVRYNPNEYYQAVKGLEHLGERSERCYACYKFRLEECAKIAKEQKYDFFTTTLSISPFKNAQWINEIGELLEKKYKVSYLYADFKKKNGYKRSIELSKQYNMYRQDYCGCVYSKIEHDKKRME
ncbi:MAG: epoxyqueuosine reductase QueH [Bacilli bacterium]|nr:epoxyqueuosine reductase QueH [Bacilli bacterium]